MVRVELDHPLARVLGDHPTLERGRDRVVLRRQDVRARNRRQPLVVGADRGGEDGDGLRAPSHDGGGCHVGRAAVVDRGHGCLVRERRDRRLAFDDDVRLDHVALPLRQAREVQQALAARGHERGDEDHRCDPIGAAPGRLGDHHAAHAVADEHRLLRPARQHLADAGGAAVERDLLDRCRVVAAAGKIERLDRVPGRLERSDHRLPAPGAAEGAVDEDEAGHDARITRLRGSISASRPIPRPPRHRARPSRP